MSIGFCTTSQAGAGGTLRQVQAPVELGVAHLGDAQRPTNIILGFQLYLCFESMGLGWVPGGSSHTEPEEEQYMIP